METKKEIGYCGLACMLCSSREGCPGCGDCSVAKCAASKGVDGCYACPEYDACAEEMPHGKRSRAFNRYAREFGKQALIERLSANAENGITYHKPDKTAGDYDVLETEDEIMRLIQFGRDDPYVKCPVFDSEHFTVRLIEENDAEDLLICYCDPDVQRIFNKDGCPPAPDWANEMPSVIRGWLDKDYANGYFIRFSVVDKQSGKAVGTMEVFDKKYETERTTGILRLDIASAYEKAQYLTELFNTANAIFFDVFHSEKILHQAFPELTERTAALTETGFCPVKLRGHRHYWANEKEPANISSSQDPYDRCPVLENENFLLRLVAPEDAEDLLPCYSQPTDSVTTNSFNCITGEGGYGTQTLDGMKKFIHFWLDDYLDDYADRHFVRWSVVDKHTRKAVGTIELFSNPSENVFFNNNGILRLDLLAGYERTAAIDDILSVLLPDAFEIFGCAKMTTKVSPAAAERIAALQAHGFKPTDERLVRRDGVYFDGFWVLEKGIAVRLSRMV